VANVPLILKIEPPKELFSLPRNRVVGLVVQPERLSGLRKARMERIGTYGKDYADLEHIHKELDYAYRIFERRRDWPLVDVTTKSIEETASEVVTLLGRTMGYIEPL
jgi:regulator of PEP synthase PpsR (kinase-PPPase family)